MRIYETYIDEDGCEEDMIIARIEDDYNLGWAGCGGMYGIIKYNDKYYHAMLPAGQVTDGYAVWVSESEAKRIVESCEYEYRRDDVYNKYPELRNVKLG